ncbi:MAG: hypothetical protein Q9186_006911 [Xanthomendoza sp. 1 TL-2023]
MSVTSGRKCIVSIVKETMSDRAEAPSDVTHAMTEPVLNPPSFQSVYILLARKALVKYSGCCHSTPHSRPNSPTTTQTPHPSRPIHRTSSTSASPRTSSHNPTLTHPPSTSRRHLPTHEPFNAPLRPHKPSPTTSPTSPTSSSSRPPTTTHPLKPNPNNNTWTPSTLRKERAEFFETRVTGQAEIWGSLRLACEALWEGDVATAQGIVDAVGVTVPTGDLVEGVFDERGGLYVLPGWVVGEPEGGVLVEEEEVEDGGVEEEEEKGGDGVGRGEKEKGKEVLESVVGMVKVRARLSDRGGPDVVVLVGREERVGVLGRRVAEEAKLSGQARIKILYLGKILKDNESLLAQGWREGHVINALVFPIRDV